MSLSSVTSSCPIMYVQLRSGGLYVQERRFHNIRGEFFPLKSVLVEESNGAVKRLCDRYAEEFINSNLHLAERFRAEHNLTGRKEIDLESLSGIGAIGVVSVRTLAVGDYVILNFSPRFDGGSLVSHGSIIPAGTVRLGKIKALEPRNPSSRPYTRHALR